MRRLVWATSVVIAACTSGGTGPTPPSPPPAPPPPPPPPPAAVASVSVSLTSGRIEVGQTSQGSVELKDANGNVLAGRQVTWSTGTTGIATVSATGLVTGVAPGTVSIIATSEGRSGSTPLQVTPIPVATVTVTLAATPIFPGQQTTAVAAIKSATGQPLTRTVAWESETPGVATVASDGTVTAWSVGTAVIAATVEGKIGTAMLAVTPAPVATVQVIASSMLDPGETTLATVILRDARGNGLAGRQVTWSSSDLAVATVNGSGLITAISPGSTIITATSESKTGTVSVSVNVGPAAKLALTRPGAGARKARAFTTQPIVQVQDAWDNAVTEGPTRVIGMTVSAGASVPAGGSATTSAGVATFTAAAITGTAGATYTLTYSSIGLVSVTQTILLDHFYFGSGTFTVGHSASSLPPGLYRSDVNTNSCYWERLSGFSGSSDIIENDIGDGPRLVQIAPTDVGFKSDRCGTWREAVGAITSSQTASFGEGQFVVGLDIAPGTWRSSGTGTTCYWARLSDFSGDGILDNDLGPEPAIVTILPGDKGFESSRCGTWVRQ